MTFDSVPTALTALAGGGIVLVVDDEDRENEGDLVLAAEFATPESIAFVVRHTSGFLCVAMPAERADELDLPPMVLPTSSTEPHGTAFTVAVDAAEGVSTGISARDRAHTARLLAAASTIPTDLNRPGHVLPLRARPRGVLERPGHTEATVDLCRLAGLSPVGVLCEVVAEDGSMARRPELLAFAREHRLPAIAIQQLVTYRRQREKAARLPTPYGTFTAQAFHSADGVEHLALLLGQPWDHGGPLVRVHRECLTSDVFGSRQCGCGAQLQHSLRTIARTGHGVVVYLRGHGTDLTTGQPADGRDHAEAAVILDQLDVRRIRLLTNNPAACAALVDAGIEVVERIALPASTSTHNVSPLRTKQEKTDRIPTPSAR